MLFENNYLRKLIILLPLLIFTNEDNSEESCVSDTDIEPQKN